MQERGAVLLWLVFISDIPVDIDSSALFMDDTNIWAVADSIQEVDEQLTQQVSAVVEWCQMNDVLINANKSALLYNSSDVSDHGIRIGDQMLKPTASAKYLGFRFKTSAHYGQLILDLTDVAAAIKRRSYLLRRVSFKLNSSELRVFGLALVMGKLNYYLPLLAAERSTGVLRCLDVALNEFMRVLTGLIRTTPIPLLHYFSKIPPLDILIQEASMRTFRRINLNTDSLLEADYRSWDGSNMGMTPFDGLYTTNVRMQNTFPELSQLDDVDSELLETGFWIKYDCLKSRQMACIMHEQCKLIPRADIYVYTDGSLKSDEHDSTIRSGAAGWMIQHEDSEIESGCCKIVPATSSYSCEMIGLHQAMCRLVELSDTGMVDLNNKSIAVLSDSRSAITHIRSTSLSNRRVDADTISILETAHALRTRGIRSLQMVWIPGHVGIEGNERADELADMGHQSDTNLVQIATPPGAIKSWIKSQKMKLMNQYLFKHVRDSRTHPDAPPRHTMKLNMKYPTELKHRTRRSMVSMNRLRAGHVMCGLTSSRIFGDADKYCRHCESAVESYEHVLMECPEVLSLDDKYRMRLLEFEIDLKHVIVSTKKHHQAAMFDLLEVLESNGIYF